MTNPERQRTIDCGQWWQELADILGWKLIAFTDRMRASFTDYHETWVELSGSQAEDILNAILTTAMRSSGESNTQAKPTA